MGYPSDGACLLAGRAAIGPAAVAKHLLLGHAAVI
jgi:hypothetical protein